MSSRRSCARCTGSSTSSSSVTFAATWLITTVALTHTSARNATTTLCGSLNSTAREASQSAHSTDIMLKVCVVFQSLDATSAAAAKTVSTRMTSQLRSKSSRILSLMSSSLARTTLRISTMRSAWSIQPRCLESLRQKSRPQPMGKVLMKTRSAPLTRESQTALAIMAALCSDTHKAVPYIHTPKPILRGQRRFTFT